MRNFFFIFAVSIFFYSCANQLPPSGGEDDRISPKIISIIPKKNSINFKGQSVKIKFDEYVDRRSFEESFFISPKPKGEINFSWSGTEVEAAFSKPLDRNKTYVIIIGKDVKDVRGGNPLGSPVSFAFSTGGKIDKGKFSGKVYTDNPDRVKILAYIKNVTSTDSLNPEKLIPDYVIQVSDDGTFELTNLPEGNYRLFAVLDEDRNNLYDKDADKIAVSDSDYSLSDVSNQVENVNFLLKDFEPVKSNKEFLDYLKSDSSNYIYSNIPDNEINIPPDYRFYFYFKNNKLTKSEIVNNFSLTDSASNKSFRLVYNWINDSLVEIFSTEKFPYSAGLEIRLDLLKTSKNYFYSARFKTAPKNSFGKVSGKISSAEKITNDVYLKLYNKGNRFVYYSKKLTDSTGFTFEDVLEGNYIFISFIDENGNGLPDRGNFFPFIPSERFIIYEKEIKIKGGWTVENIFINF